MRCGSFSRLPFGASGSIEDDLAGDRPALGQRRVVDALDPVVGPLRILFLRLREGVLPQRVRVVGPACGDGRIAGRRGQRIQLGLGGGLRIVERVDVDEDRPDDLVPLFTCGNAGARAVVVAAVPVVEDDRLGVAVVAEVRVEVDAGRAAAEVFNRRIDEPHADVVLGARPAVSLRPVLHAGVAVLVLDGVLVDALVHDALLFGMDDHARAPVRRRGLQHVAVLVHRDPVEGLVEPGRCSGPPRRRPPPDRTPGG